MAMNTFTNVIIHLMPLHFKGLNFMTTKQNVTECDNDSHSSKIIPQHTDTSLRHFYTNSSNLCVK